jgi:dTDP-4-amino-4,6-dideoxygalactose transaminase
MNQVFWIGVYPGLTRQKVDYILSVFHTLGKGT